MITISGVSQDHTPSTSTSRHAALDGYRGLAALLVFVGHAVGLVYFPAFGNPAGETFWRKLLWDGSTLSVDFFFVLSGFVLALPFMDGRTLHYSQFLLRRVVRLYPTHLFLLLLALACRYGMHPGPFVGLSDLMWSIKGEVTGVQLLAHALLVYPNPQQELINPVLWSLIVEARMALVLPWWIHWVRNAPNVWSEGKILFWAFLASLLGVFFTDSAPYLLEFVVGVVLARHHQVWLRGLQRQPQLHGLVLMVSVGLIFNRTFLPEWIISNRYISSLGAAGLILCILTMPALRRLGEGWILQAAGRVSYPFYLCHLPILLLVTSHLFPVTHSIALCVTASAVVALGCAWVAHQLVERPGMLWLSRRRRSGG